MKVRITPLWSSLLFRLFATLAFAAIGAVAVFRLAVFWALVDPPPPLRVSLSTTRVVQPLAADGLPDYASAFLGLLGPKPEPQDNGAILLWRSVGADRLDANESSLLFAELGCDQPDACDALRLLTNDDFYFATRDWLASRGFGHLDVNALSSMAGALISASWYRPTDATALAPLEGWVSSNRVALEVLREAATLPSFYSPPPGLLTEEASSLIDIGLPLVDSMRRAFSSLAASSMWKLGSGDTTNAWKDIDACLAIADKAGELPMVVAQLVRYRGQQRAYRCLRALLSTTIDPSLCRDVLRRLRSSADQNGVAYSLEVGEPLMAMDEAVRGLNPQRIAKEIDAGRAYLFVDSNRALNYVRGWQDKQLAVALTADRCERRRRLRLLEDAVTEMSESMAHPIWQYTRWFSRASRSRQFGRACVSMLLPALGPAVVCEDRTVALKRLVMTAAVLRIHRLEQGIYPERLSDLVAVNSGSKISDPFSNQPFRYERRGDGFVLWSVGPNETDDGANDEQGEFIDGEYAPIDWFGEREKPVGVDDIVVRLPVPPLQFPAELAKP